MPSPLLLRLLDKGEVILDLFALFFQQFLTIVDELSRWLLSDRKLEAFIKGSLAIFEHLLDPLLCLFIKAVFKG